LLKLDDVISRITQYQPRANVDLICKAYVYSAKAHEGQLRKSGQPFVVHPLEVASILIDMKLDVPSIAAGILHDTLEDTKATKDELVVLFGKEIAELVDGVTKLSKLQFNNQEDRQAENYRKMIMAMSRDIRVILVKLADRLNNMRTLQFMPEEKQMRIARETLDIYAPLASRLGIDWIKNQLEDLSLRFLKPDIYRQLEKKIGRLRKNKEAYIEKVIEAIKQHLGKEKTDLVITGRVKHIYGIYHKMERQNISFEQVHDLVAFRILTKNVEECYEVLGHLHSLWKPVPGRFKDYIGMPKSNNYQSLHTIVICLDGERVEFQIRTHEMHEIGEKGIAAHWKYKDDGTLDMESEMTFQWLRQLVEWQNELKDSIEFMDTFKVDLFASDIYVFTPKGDVRALPYGSTPIDFAYSIHSEIGTHCFGAKLNGKIVPLSYKLQSGDTIEIQTHPKRLPTKDWLKIAVSSRARAQVRQYLKQEQKDKSLILGKNIFEEEVARYGLEVDELLKNEALWEYAKKKGITGEANLFASIAYGKISMGALLNYVAPDKKPQEVKEDGILRKIFKKVSKKTRDLVLIDGMDEILVAFGKCCSPIQGDPIVGFVTRGRGVMIHRTECPKAPIIDPQRRIHVAWNKVSDTARIAKLKITCINKTGMLAEIAKTISERKIGITKALVQTTKDEKAIISLDVGVKSLMELNHVMKAVESIDGVIIIQREIG